MACLVRYAKAGDFGLDCLRHGSVVEYLTEQSTTAIIASDTCAGGFHCNDVTALNITDNAVGNVNKYIILE
jgi:hypothetical protein